jgi:hypothetical protein
MMHTCFFVATHRSVLHRSKNMNQQQPKHKSRKKKWLTFSSRNLGRENWREDRIFQYFIRTQLGGQMKPTPKIAKWLNGCTTMLRRI